MNGRLSISTAFDGKKAVTQDFFFAPPFKVYSPFYDDKGWAKYISMCGSAGVLAGDENEISLNIGEFCKVIFTDQGYQKLFNTNGGVSAQRISITAAKNSALCYLPHPIMTFTGCDHVSTGKIDITESSTLVFSEIYCCGRTAMGEEFGLKRFRSRTEIAIDGRADFIDNTLISHSTMPIRAKGFFEGFTHTGFMYIYTPQREILESIHENFAFATDEISLCSTHTERGLAVRALANSGEEIFDAFTRIAQQIQDI